jgi:hypothetical protein
MSSDKQFKKFQKLDEDFRTNMMQVTDAEIFSTITKCALNVIALNMAKEADEDLASLQEQLKVAKEQYTTGVKTNNLKIEFCAETLKSRGVDVPSVEDFLRSALKAAVDE